MRHDEYWLAIYLQEATYVNSEDKFQARVPELMHPISSPFDGVYTSETSVP